MREKNLFAIPMNWKLPASSKKFRATAGERVTALKADRIISLNLRHGGGSRIAQLTDWLVSKSPSVVIATEWRNNIPGQFLQDRLALNGLNSIAMDAATSQSNSVLVATSRVRIRRELPHQIRQRAISFFASLDDFSILGCYFPQGSAKAPFFHCCIEITKQHSQSPFIMVGDLNTGRNDLDIEGNGVSFYCADQFVGLHEQAGLTDLWRLRHGERRDWTWRSNKNGFRIDHAFGNQAFVDRFPNFRCEIDHEPRVTELTDHSAIILDLE
jgi:exonuclease III